MNIHNLCEITLNAKKTTSLFVRFLLLILAISLSPVACSDSSSSKPKVKPELAPKTIDGKVHFTLGTTKFVIPKKYMASVSHNHLGITDTARLLALLPNFEGYEEHNKDEFSEIKVRGWGRRLYVDINFDKKRYDNSGLLENNYPDIILKRNYIERIYDLEVYPEYNFRIDITHHDSLKYIYWKEKKPIVIIDCNKENSYPSPSCKGRWDFNSEILVEFSFHLKYLPQWKNTWKKLDALLKNDPSFTTINNEQ